MELIEQVFVEATLQKNPMGLKKIVHILGSNNSSTKIKCSWLAFVSWQKSFHNGKVKCLYKNKTDKLVFHYSYDVVFSTLVVNADNYSTSYSPCSDFILGK